MLQFFKRLLKMKPDSEQVYRRREREVDLICNDIRDKYPNISRAAVEDIIDMTLSFVEREVDFKE